MSVESIQTVVDVQADRKHSRTRSASLIAKLPWIPIVQILVVAVILLGVQIAVDSGAVKRIYLASPTQIVAAFPQLFTRENLLFHLSITLAEAGVGVGLSAVLGIATGIAMGLFPKVHQFLNPFLVWLMAIPKVTIIPLLTLYLGLGFEHKVFIIFLFCYFLFVFNTIAGIRQVQDSHIKVARTLGASRRQIIWKVVLPSATPSIMAAVRIEAATCLLATLFAEIVASKAGVGNLLNKLSGIYDTAGVFALVILVTSIALLIIYLVDLLERRVLLRWKYV